MMSAVYVWLLGGLTAFNLCYVFVIPLFASGRWWSSRVRFLTCAVLLLLWIGVDMVGYLLLELNEVQQQFRANMLMASICGAAVWFFGGGFLSKKE